MDETLKNPESLRQRLAAKTERDGECLLFTTSIGTHGYGTIWDGEKSDVAHRVSYRLHHGPIPKGMFVCHRCDRRACVEPTHLFLGSQFDNMADMTQKSRRSSGPKHANAIKAGWTPELRLARAEQTRERMRLRREAAATAAGVPVDWKYCAACATWKPRTDYQRNAARDDGLKSKCRPCATIEVRESRAKKETR